MHVEGTARRLDVRCRPRVEFEYLVLTRHGRERGCPDVRDEWNHPGHEAVDVDRAELSNHRVVPDGDAVAVDHHGVGPLPRHRKEVSDQIVARGRGTGIRVWCHLQRGEVVRETADPVLVRSAARGDSDHDGFVFGDRNRRSLVGRGRRRRGLLQRNRGARRRGHGDGERVRPLRAPHVVVVNRRRERWVQGGRRDRNHGLRGSPHVGIASRCIPRARLPGMTVGRPSIRCAGLCKKNIALAAVSRGGVGGTSICSLNVHRMRVRRRSPISPRVAREAGRLGARAAAGKRHHEGRDYPSNRSHGASLVEDLIDAIPVNVPQERPACHVELTLGSGSAPPRDSHPACRSKPTTLSFRPRSRGSAPLGPDGRHILPNAIKLPSRLTSGGAKGDRTPDLRIANAALSQLSYCPGKEAPESTPGTSEVKLREVTPRSTSETGTSLGGGSAQIIRGSRTPGPERANPSR